MKAFLAEDKRYTSNATSDTFVEEGWHELADSPAKMQTCVQRTGSKYTDKLVCRTPGLRKHTAVVCILVLLDTASFSFDWSVPLYSHFDIGKYIWEWHNTSKKKASQTIRKNMSQMAHAASASVLECIRKSPDVILKTYACSAASGFWAQCRLFVAHFKPIEACSFQVRDGSSISVVGIDHPSCCWVLIKKSG